MAIDNTVFVTNAGKFSTPTISPYEQRLLRLAGKIRATAVAIHFGVTGPTFNTGSPTEWKTLIALVEGSTKVTPLTEAQCRAATVNAIWNAISSPTSFDTAYAFIKPMIGFQDETRLARIEAYVDALAYDGIINGS